MVSNFELRELKWRFLNNTNCAAGNEITAHSDLYVVITNLKQMRIAQIYRTSANRYEIITACGLVCTRTHRSSFAEAADKVNKFLSGL